ncbi:nucleotidyltransferase [Haliscomenobacter hydrossis]|uniref:Cyclic GMP-AMP synthase n=1 Tax=Haliscomenobacter hydrossis (strain ATCC 27775 / DSM 1100 / LMG 10767 / O) TaxID=760192 RepID=F4L840_HALH1|nr:nucleotidyltransferase [Haliscomenobacter hydrossis]AEE54548.1 hypothetical protein Halhy_6733 [Haliscomenobacter hydrossis DSM 1100]
MIKVENRVQLNYLLERLAEALDITPTQFAEAKAHYEAVGAYLGADGSALAHLNPAIFPQGSMRLGTVVRPLSDEDQYDVDLVCKVEGTTADFTQYELKQMIGDRLKESDRYRNMLDEEYRFCWTLNYADATRFHMDILPAIADINALQELPQINPHWTVHALHITDQLSETYKKYSNDWPKSNPTGYAEWFMSRMKTQFEARRKAMALEMRASVEEIQDHQVKTPLQRSVQILKRHRDIMFEGKEHRPISIIITTLAARAYAEEADVYTAIGNILDRMPAHIRRINGVAVIENPVNPIENFAADWAKFPQQEENFYKWVVQAKKDFISALSFENITDIRALLHNSFGDKIANRAINLTLEIFPASPSLEDQKNQALLAMATKATVKPWCRS